MDQPDLRPHERAKGEGNRPEFQCGHSGTFCLFVRLESVEETVQYPTSPHERTRGERASETVRAKGIL